MMMDKYKVKLIYKYSDTVHVEAFSKEEAIEKALEECDEKYESFYDAEVSYDD